MYKRQILACVTLHFYFRKKKKALSSGKEKEKPIRGAVRKEGQERAYPVICVVFQPELEEEELAAEIADMYLHGRAYYYSGTVSYTHLLIILLQSMNIHT